MKKTLFALALLLILGTGIAYAKPWVSYVGTILPVDGDNANDIGTSTSEFRNFYLQGNFVNSSQSDGCAEWTSGILGSSGSACGSGSGGGGSGIGWTWNGKNLLRTTTTTDDVLIGRTSTTTNSKLEVLGTTTASQFVATSTTDHSTFPYASSTATTVSGTASSSNSVISNSINIFGGGAKTTANALCIQLTGSSALCDGSDDGSGSGVWPFTTTDTNYNVAVQSTTTPEWFKNGLYASSTSQIAYASSTAITVGTLYGGNTTSAGRLTLKDASDNTTIDLIGTSGTASSTETYISSLATPAGTFLAADPSGKVIATTTPAGGSLSGGTAGMLTSWVDSTTVTATSAPTVGYVTATSTVASKLPYASTTQVTVSSTAYMPGTSIWNSSGRVGVGTVLPQRSINAVDNTFAGLLLRTNAITNGSAAGIEFSVTTDATQYIKGGLSFKRTSSNGRGDLIFSLNKNDDSTNVSSAADQKMILTQYGVLAMSSSSPSTNYGTVFDNGNMLVGGTITSTSTGTTTIMGGIELGSTTKALAISKETGYMTNGSYKMAFTEISTSSSQSIAQAFETIDFTNGTQTDYGNNWDEANNWYVVPVSGIYKVTTKLRYADNSSVYSYGQGADTSNTDTPNFQWSMITTGLSTNRQGSLNVRTSHFNKGDQLRMFSYVDNASGLNIASADMTVELMTAD